MKISNLDPFQIAIVESESHERRPVEKPVARVEHSDADPGPSENGLLVLKEFLERRKRKGRRHKADAYLELDQTENYLRERGAFVDKRA